MVSFLFMATIHALLAATFAVSRARDEVAEVAESDRIILRQIASSLEATYQRGAIQLQHLDTLLRVMLDEPNDFVARKQEITDFFLQVALSDPNLDQIRFIGASGREIIRINRENGTVKIVADGALQDKSDRPYFVEASTLEAEAFYVSDLDLNIEDGAIEYPLKPMIRLAKPYRAGSGELVGVVVLNIRPEGRIEKLVGTVGRSRLLVTDRFGHWLFGAGADNFSHIVRSEDVTSNLPTLYPQAWDLLSADTNGAGLTPQGHFQFIKFTPLSGGLPAYENAMLQGGNAGFPFSAIAFMPTGAIVALSPIGQPEFWILNAIVLSALGAAVWLFQSRRAARQQLVLALERERDTAVRAERFKSDFMAKMSHELRTPLNGVLGILDAVIPEVDDTKLRRELGLVRSSGRLLERLVADVLDTLRIEGGNFQLRNEAFSPLETAQAVQSAMSLLAEQGGTRIAVEAAPSAMGRFIGDAERLSQVLFNLVGNAVKFTTNGTIVIGIEARHHGSVEIEIRDTGSGMDQSEIDVIIARIRSGHQADVPTLRTYGLGLHIVWVLVKEMGGTFEMQSARGSGTRVRIGLPLPPAPGQAEEVDSPTGGTAKVIDFGAAVTRPAGSLPPETDTALPAGAPAISLAGRRVLAADDIPTNQLVLSSILGKLGIGVTMTSDGSEALAAWRPEAFDIVLLDIMMPNMDGLEAMTAIRKKAEANGEADVVFVAVTANALPEQIESYLAAGFRACVTKPVSRAKLEAAISEALTAAPNPCRQRHPLPGS